MVAEQEYIIQEQPAKQIMYKDKKPEIWLVILQAQFPSEGPLFICVYLHNTASSRAQPGQWWSAGKYLSTVTGKTF